jgi:hypothetical protein
LKPVSLNVREYVPGLRLGMRYCPASSVTAMRTFSMSAGLEASTVTPGSTPPDWSLTVPVRVPCAKTSDGKRVTATRIKTGIDALRMVSPS